MIILQSLSFLILISLKVIFTLIMFFKSSFLVLRCYCFSVFNFIFIDSSLLLALRLKTCHRFHKQKTKVINLFSFLICMFKARHFPLSLFSMYFKYFSKLYFHFNLKGFFFLTIFFLFI